MRCAIIATPALLPDSRPAPGALDGDLLRTRLPQPDTGFTVVDLDCLHMVAQAKPAEVATLIRERLG